CALTAAGAVRCWGSNSDGQLGNNDLGNDSSTPVAVSGLDSGAVAIAAGAFSTCAIMNTGALQCWGVAVPGGSAVPVVVSGLETGVAAVAGGTFHTCVVTTGGAALCWGRNNVGQLGNGSTSPTTSFTPGPVSGLGSGVVAIAAGDNHTCAVTGTGGVK